MRAWILITTLAALGASGAHAQDASPSRSIGAPNRGRLENGVRLRGNEAVMLQRGSDQWGTAELVGLIERASERLQSQAPGPRLLVGDLSRQRGGRLRPHRSHQNGRDADLGLFVTDQDGQAIEPPRFLELDQHACASERGVAYCFDPRRTFLFITALLEDSITRVQWILIAADLRQRILAAGRRLDVSPELLERVEAATAPRDGSESHRSHLHVRILCPEDDVPRCQEHTVSRRRPAASSRQRARARRARARRARAAARRAQARD
jgi:penicillin-insensitive murein endopeptidase